VNSGEFALHCTKTQHSRKKHKNIASAEPTITPQFLWIPCIKTQPLLIIKHYITDFEKKKKKTEAAA
jgi:hypothetical protein